MFSSFSLKKISKKPPSILNHNGLSFGTVTMESKTSDYDPLMTSDARSSLADDSSNTADEALLDRYQRRQRLMKWVPNILVGAVFVLIWLVIALIVVVLTHKPTDLQCSTQLSTYCKLTCPWLPF